jgi:insulysin
MATKLPNPIVLVDEPAAKIYYGQDHFFLTPHTQWVFEIKTPFINPADPFKVVVADLYIKCLKDVLNPYAYPAQVADLTYEASRTTNGISLSILGYYENAEILFDLILTHLKNCTPTEAQFHLFKESLLRRYNNFKEEGPLYNGFETYHTILYESYSTLQQRAQALEEISYEMFIKSLPLLYAQTYTDGLFYGNISEAQALKVWNKLQTRLDSQTYPKEERLVERIFVLNDQLGPFSLDIETDSRSHASILIIEAPHFTFKNRAAQQILGQALNSAFYSTLRTQQQTGYLVFSKEDEIEKKLFFYFAVQSATHDPSDLLARFELFLESFLQEMDKKELTREGFENIRQSLINTLEHTPQNLAEAGTLLKTLAFDYEGDFQWMNKRIQGFKELTYEEFLEIAKQFLGKQNKRRLAINVRGIIEKEFRYFPLPQVIDVKKLSRYASFNE